MIVVGAVLTVVIALAVALLLELRSLAVLALAVYVLSIAEIVFVIEALSLVRGVTEANVLAAQAILLGLTAGALIRRRPQVPSIRVPGGLLSLTAKHPLVAVLFAFVLTALAYQLALALLTPPNNWDSMAYHLSRAAAWYQHQGIAYINAHTSRENAFQPNAEILVLYTFVLSRGDRFAAAWQWVAEPASMVAIFLLARRAGFVGVQALFGALLFACLSDVALQSVTTQNDLLTASLVVAAAAFLTSGERAQLWLGSLAFALAVGTKLTAVFALPLIVLMVAVTLEQRARRQLLGVAVVMMALFASFGFVLNFVETGSLLGAPSATTGFLQDSAVGFVQTIAGVIATTILDVAPMFTANEDLSYYGPLGAVLVVPVIALTLQRWRRGRATTLEGIFALAMPLYLVGLALTYRWNLFIGRFMVTPAALLAPLFAGVYRASRYTTAVVVVATLSLTATMLFDHAKPSGIGGGPSIWTMTRAEAEAVQRPSMRPVLEALEACVPSHTSVGHVLGKDDWDYPLYGTHLTRHLARLHGSSAFQDATRAGLRWVLVRQRLLINASAPGWQSIPFPASRLSLFWQASPTVSGTAQLPACATRGSRATSVSFAPSQRPPRK